MKLFAQCYLAVLAVFVVGDAVWLSRAADAFYRPAMGDMALQGVRPAPAVGFYLLYGLGVVIFAVAPRGHIADWVSAGWHGALFGLCAYATYDLTNQATLRQWSSLLSFVDMGWGSLLTGVSAAIAAALVSRL